MSGLVGFLGEKLEGKDGEIETSSLDGNDVVALYFSAHWCPPCRGFTPELVTLYNKLKENGKKIEIIFVSSDRDEGAFKSYFAEMPWLCLPFADRKRKAKLSKKFKVRGIPSLILLHPTGRLMNRDGRTAISSDPEGTKFPWDNPPKKFSDVFTEELINPKRESIPTSSLSDCYIGLYFSAHWCPPCKTFTPKLAEWYNKNKDKGEKLEIVFVSSDRDQDSFNEYYDEMPWLALPFDKRDTKTALSTLYGVEGIPTFVIVDGRNGELVTVDGRGSVMSDPNKEKFPWPKQPAAMLDGSNIDAVNETTVMIIFAKSETEERQEQLLGFLNKHGSRYLQESKNNGDYPDMEIEFRVENGKSGFNDRLRTVMGMDETHVMGIVDVPTKKCFLHEIRECNSITQEMVDQFIQKFEDGSLGEGNNLAL